MVFEERACSLKNCFSEQAHPSGCVWSRREGAAFWTFFSSPGARLCALPRRAVRWRQWSVFFFFLISHQSFPSLKVGDDFWNTQALLVTRSLPLKKKKFCLAFEQFDPTSPWLKSQHDCTYHPASWSCGVFFFFFLLSKSFWYGILALVMAGGQRCFRDEFRLLVTASDLQPGCGLN